MSIKNSLKKPLIFMVVTTAIILGSYTSFNKKVEFTIDGQTVKIDTISPTVGAFLKSNNIKIEEGCRLEPSIDTKLENNMEIKITNQYKININDAGEIKEYKTNQEVVSKVLEECNIILNEKDRLNKKLGDTVKPNDTIEITRVKEETMKEVKEIPFETKIVGDKKLLKGTTQKQLAGKSGELEIRYKVVYENGELISKKKISEKIIKEPTAEIVKKGSLETHTI